MIDYRAPLPGDAAGIDALGRRVWLETFGHSAPAADIQAYVAGAYGPDGTLRRHLADPTYDWRVAADGGTVAGYCKLGPTFFTDEVPTDDAVHLHQLYVDPAHHGAGIAVALLDWAKDRARQRSATALLLTVWEENARARRFYQKHGFVHVADYAFQTGSQVDRDLILRLAL